MAEDEVVKHTRKIYKIWNSKDRTPWQKAKEFMLEIFIIVFAVTLSIWVHDKSELAHQRKEVKEFMLGLKQDLTGDITEMNEDKKSYELSHKAFKYISDVKLRDTLNRDSVNEHSHWIFNTTGLVPNNGRFEGFKASGKIGTIENKELQNDIMDLYQENIPQLLMSTNMYTQEKLQLFAYIDAHRQRTTDSTTNIRRVLKSDEVYNMSGKLRSTGEILERYDACIAKMNKIIGEIDKEYGKDN